MKIEQRTFIVSGGSSGLGLSTVEGILREGGYAAIVDLKAPDAPAVASAKDKARFWELNVTKVDDIAKVVEEVALWAKQTGAALGGVINCAGVGIPAKLIGKNGQPHSLDVWNLVIAVNLSGTFHLTRLACKHLIEVPPESPDSERGVIVMVASSAAFEGQPGQTAYAGSKGALISMTLPMARDLGRYGIRVVTVAPGAFVSPMTSVMTEKTRESVSRDLLFPRRMGEPHEFAQTVKWILECPYVNGETIRLSGGSRLPGRL